MTHGMAHGTAPCHLVLRFALCNGLPAWRTPAGGGCSRGGGCAHGAFWLGPRGPHALGRSGARGRMHAAPCCSSPPSCMAHDHTSLTGRMATQL